MSITNTMRVVKRILVNTRLLFVVCTVTMISSCQRERVLFSEYAQISHGWTYEDSIRFDIDVPDTAQEYDIRLEVRHNTTYAWQNLYVKILTGFPNDSVKTDILSLELANGSGAWMGKCSGEQCKTVIPIQSRVRFPAPGGYSLTFLQNMRQEQVPDILGLGLSVVESQALKD